MMIPFPGKPNIDVTDEMVKQVSVEREGGGDLHQPQEIIWERLHELEKKNLCAVVGD